MSKEEIKVISANADNKAVQEIIERERRKKAEEEKVSEASEVPEKSAENMEKEAPQPDIKTIQNEKNSKKQNKKLIVIGGVLFAVILVAVIFFSGIYPGMKADNAFDEYMGSYQSLLDQGEYNSAIKNAEDILKEYDANLDDSQKSTLKGIRDYSSGVKLLDYTSETPAIADEYKAEKCIKSAKDYCSGDIIPHDLCNELLSGINQYYDDYHGIHGTLTVDHSKFDVQEEKVTDDSIGGTAFDLNNQVSFDTGRKDAQFIAVDGGSYKKYNSGGSANIEWTHPDDVNGEEKTESKDEKSEKEDEKSEPEKEEPVVNEYNCSGIMSFGFRKKDSGKGLTKDNIETIYIVDIHTITTPEEAGVSSDYKAVFTTDQTEGIEVKGSDETVVIGTATYKNGDFKVDLGKGVTLNVSTAKIETPSTENSSQSSKSSSGSSSSSSSSNKKDYSPGSEWEKYDSDADGKINDKEFQDATNDYMDKYYQEISDGGNNLDVYDYNNDGEMATDEFQDAVGDYMDSHGY